LLQVILLVEVMRDNSDWLALRMYKRKVATTVQLLPSLTQQPVADGIWQAISAGIAGEMGKRRGRGKMSGFVRRMSFWAKRRICSEAEILRFAQADKLHSESFNVA
jgi:hypothetical protein